MGYGYNGFARVAMEGTYGTAETSDFWNLQIDGEEVVSDHESIPNDSIPSGRARNAPAQGVKFSGGPIRARATYNLMDQLLYSCFGVFTESTPTGGTTTRDHWCELLGPGSTVLPVVTLEINPCDIESNDFVHVFPGSVVNRFDLTIPASGQGTIEVEVMGKYDASAAGGEAASALHANGNQAQQFIYAHHLQSGWDVGPAPDSGTYCIKTFNLSVNRNLERRYCQGDQEPKQPLITTFPSVTGSFDIEFDDRNVYESFRNFTTETTGVLDYHGATIEGALKYGLKVKLLSYVFMAPSRAFASSQGKLIANCPFVADFGNSGTAATTSPDSDSTLMPLAIRTRNINVKSTL